MISKIKFNMVAVFILAIGVFAGAALAQDTTTTTPNKDNTQRQNRPERRGEFKRGGEGFRGGPRGPEAMLREFRDLNLTDAQKEQIHTILESNKPTQAEMDQMKAIRDGRQNGTELTADQKAQLKANREAQRSKMESVHQQILAVLTPEQKAQLDAKRAERQKHWQENQGAGKDKPADKPAAKPTNN